MSAFGAIFVGSDVQHLAGHGDLVNAHGQPGEQKYLAHLKKHIVSQPTGVVVIARIGRGLVQKTGDPGTLIAVAVGKAEFLLPEIAVFIKFLPEILQCPFLFPCRWTGAADGIICWNVFYHEISRRTTPIFPRTAWGDCGAAEPVLACGPTPSCCIRTAGRSSRRCLARKRDRTRGPDLVGQCVEQKISERVELCSLNGWHTSPKLLNKNFCTFSGTL